MARIVHDNGRNPFPEVKMIALSMLAFANLLGCTTPVAAPEAVPATVIVRSAPAAAPAPAPAPAHDSSGNSLAIDVTPGGTSISIDAKKRSN